VLSELFQVGADFPRIGQLEKFLGLDPRKDPHEISVIILDSETR
jgi:hypothetical protein